MFGTVVERSTVFRNLSEKGPPESWDGDSELYGMMTALEPDDRPSAAEVLVAIFARAAHITKIMRNC
jgi:hypothetical protein